MGYNDPHRMSPHPLGESDSLDRREWDIHDDALFHDLVGSRVGPAVQNLLIAAQQLDMTRDSFGANAERAVKHLQPLLVDLRRAVKDAYLDSL